MTNKKVLVIGGNGFIGRNLVKFLASQPEITIYSFDLGKPLQQIEGVKYIEGDFFDDYLIKNAIKGIDVVIHSLSTINPGNSNSKYMQGYSRDFLQTVKLCGLLVEQKSNMIFLSSGGTVYGEQIKQPINETISPKPINHYGGVKLCIENVIQIFNTQLHSKMRIARISNPYGPGQDYNKGVGFIDATIKKALAQEVLEIWGDGENIRDYIFIDDVCKMLYALICYEGEKEVFNLSSNVGISQNEVVQAVRMVCPEIKVEYKPSRSVDIRKIILDNSQITELYKGEIVNFEDGIRKYYHYLVSRRD